MQRHHVCAARASGLVSRAALEGVDARRQNSGVASEIPVVLRDSERSSSMQRRYAKSGSRERTAPWRYGNPTGGMFARRGKRFTIGAGGAAHGSRIQRPIGYASCVARSTRLEALIGSLMSVPSEPQTAKDRGTDGLSAEANIAADGCSMASTIKAINNDEKGAGKGRCLQSSRYAFGP
jgi:hypothetical protein